MSQILAGAGPYTLIRTWYVDGTATDVGAVTIGIVDGNGDEVVAAGTATTNNADGTYTYSLADQANPDELKATWTRTSTGADLLDRIEVIGGWLFTEAQARTFGAKADATSALKPLASADEYPDATIADERARIVDDFENWTGRSWIPRYARIEFAGTGGRTLDVFNGRCVTSDGYTLHRPARHRDIAAILSVTDEGTAVTASNVDFDPDAGVFYRLDGVWTAASVDDRYNVVIEYVYGMPNPGGADRVALLELVNRLVPSPHPQNALSWEGPDGGNLRFVQPGGPMNNKSRVPAVNEWVNSNNWNAPFG